MLTYISSASFCEKNRLIWFFIDQAAKISLKFHYDGMAYK